MGKAPNSPQGAGGRVVVVVVVVVVAILACCKWFGFCISRCGMLQIVYFLLRLLSYLLLLLLVTSQCFGMVNDKANNQRCSGGAWVLKGPKDEEHITQSKNKNSKQNINKLKTTTTRTSITT